jgi:hypothetical protein
VHAAACDITGWCMHLTGLCMHVLHALPHDVTGWCIQLLHGLCCFDFVSDIPLLQLLCNGPVIFKWCKSKLPLKKMNGTYFKTVISLNLSKMQCSKMYFMFLMSIDFTVTINWDTFFSGATYDQCRCCGPFEASVQGILNEREGSVRLTSLY